jgi:peptide/nickel transport system permease protein
MSSSQSVRPILKRLRSGQKTEAAILLARRLERDANDEVAWHLLSSALDDRGRQVYCLERVLEINPANEAAATRLAELSEAEEGGEAAEESEEESAQARQPRPPPGARRPACARAEAPATPQPRLAPAQQGGAAAAPAIAFPEQVVVPRRRQPRWPELEARLPLGWQRLRLDWQAFSESRLALLGLGLLALFGLMALAQPILMRTAWPAEIYDPVAGYDPQIVHHPSLPGRGHLLGTDALGRDVLSMLLAAARPALLLALAAGLSAAVVGTALGAMAAWFRGRADMLITNLADVFLLLPAPVLMVILGVRFRDLGPVQLGLIYGLLTGAGAVALILRDHALRIVARPYTQAAKVSGGSSWHIAGWHLLPALLPLAGMQMMLAVPGAIVADGFISFFGQARPASNWGTLVYEAFLYQRTGSTLQILHLLVPAALSLSLFALAFYLVSRGLQRVAWPALGH